MKLNRFTHALLSTSILSISLSACTRSCDSSPSSTEVGDKKILNIVRVEAFRSLDPVKQFDESSAELIYNLYDRILEYSYLERPYKLQPGLAQEMPVKSEDGLTYTFKLREGVYFHDDACFEGGKGREMTADDAIYTLKRFADARANQRSYVLMAGYVKGMDDFREQTKSLASNESFDSLELPGINKISDYEFSITLTQANPLALFPLAMSQLSVVPREAIEKYGSDFERHAVGTGPFKIKEMSRRGELILSKHYRYWDVFPTQGEEQDQQMIQQYGGQALPFVDEVRMPLIEESQPAILSFKKGEVDFVRIATDNFSTFFVNEDGKIFLNDDWKDRIQASAVPSMSMENLKFNMKDNVVGGYAPERRALRQAIAHALNIQGFIDLMLNGRAVLLKGIVPHPIAGSEWEIPVESHEYNQEMARQKLAESGYPEGKGLPELEFEYRASTTATRRSWEFIRNDLAAVGIKAKANFQTFSAWLQKTEKGNYQISNAGWQADYPDAENFYQLLVSTNLPPGPNDGSFKSDEYDRLYHEIRFMENGPERFEKFKRLNQIILDDTPMIPMYNAMRVELLSPWVRNFKRNLMNHPPLKYLDVDQSRKAQGI